MDPFTVEMQMPQRDLWPPTSRSVPITAWSELSICLAEQPSRPKTGPLVIREMLISPDNHISSGVVCTFNGVLLIKQTNVAIIDHDSPVMKWLDVVLIHAFFYKNNKPRFLAKNKNSLRTIRASTTSNTLRTNLLKTRIFCSIITNNKKQHLKKAWHVTPAF